MEAKKLSMLRLQYWAGDVQSESVFNSIRENVGNNDVFVATTRNVKRGGIDAILLSKTEVGEKFVTWARLSLADSNFISFNEY